MPLEKKMHRYGDKQIFERYPHYGEPYGNATHPAILTYSLYQMLLPHEYQAYDKSLKNLIKKRSNERGDIVYSSDLNVSNRYMLRYFSDEYWQNFADYYIQTPYHQIQSYNKRLYMCYEDNNPQAMEAINNEQRRKYTQNRLDVMDKDENAYSTAMQNRLMIRLDIELPKTSNMILTYADNLMRNDNLLSRLQEKGYTLTPLALDGKPKSSQNQ